MKFTDLPKREMQQLLNRLPDANEYHGEYVGVDIIQSRDCICVPQGSRIPNNQEIQTAEFRKQRFADRYGNSFYDWVLV